MIFDHIHNASIYKEMHPSFKRAFEYLKSTDFNNMENGKYVIDDDKIFAIVNRYTTEAAEARQWEAHRTYIDIQYMVSGEENMGVAPLHHAKIVKPYDRESDFMLLEVLGEEFTIKPKFFTIFFPSDVHKPNLITKEPQQVLKVVVKVKVEPQQAMQLCFASNNKHKLEEIRLALADSRIDMRTMQELGVHDTLSETGTTLEYNAWQKANQLFTYHGINAFADDTGLEVEALEGMPGVYSARYAGEKSTSQKNIEKLLKEMNGIENRKAKFRTVICLIINSAEYRFEGEVEGVIAESPRGEGGFGYDSVFIPEGQSRTFAEMSPVEKSSISHRSRAIQKMVLFLKEEFLKNEPHYE